MRLAGMSRPLKPIPVFKQEPGETQRRFFNRMETTVQVLELKIGIGREDLSGSQQGVKK